MVSPSACCLPPPQPARPLWAAAGGAGARPVAAAPEPELGAALAVAAPEQVAAAGKEQAEGQLQAWPLRLSPCPLLWPRPLHTWPQKELARG